MGKDEIGASHKEFVGLIIGVGSGRQVDVVWRAISGCGDKGVDVIHDVREGCDSSISECEKEGIEFSVIYQIAY